MNVGAGYTAMQIIILLIFISFCDKNMGMQVFCRRAGYSPENTCTVYSMFLVIFIPNYLI